MTFQIWNPDVFPLPGQAVFDREHQQVTAVSRSSGNLDLFVIGDDGHVWTTWWDDQRGWHSDFAPIPGRAVFDREHQQVTAVSRSKGNLDLYVIGFDGHVWSSWWDEQRGWAPDFVPVRGQAVFDREHQHVAVVSRAKGNLDLYVIGFDGHVWSSWWDDQRGWAPDFVPVRGQAVFDREHQQVTVVSRAKGNLDLYVIGNDGHVWTTWWDDQHGWNSDFVPVRGQAVFDREHQHVAAVSRSSGNLDLFVIANDGHVWTTWWDDQHGWNSDFAPVPGRAVFDQVHQHVAAVSRAKGNLDLFVIGNDGLLRTTWWNEQQGWNPDFAPVPEQVIFDREHQHVAAVSRASCNLDLFLVGYDGHIWSTYWGPRAEMTLEATVDQSVPRQVGLHIAASEGIVLNTEWSMTLNGVPAPATVEHVAAGAKIDRIYGVNQPGRHAIDVRRTGYTGPGAPVTLTRHFDLDAQETGTASPRPSGSPTIQVSWTGTIPHAKFHVTGQNFVPNLPANQHGVAIRFVDAASLITTRREFAASSSTGTIDHVIEGDIGNLTIDALGRATAAISATDGRPLALAIDGLLWSNTVDITFWLTVEEPGPREGVGAAPGTRTDG